MDDPTQPQTGVERIRRANTLTIRIEGREGHDTGGPLQSFLLAMRQSLGILVELGRELTDGRETLDWQIVEASYTNPLSVIIEGRSQFLDRRPVPVAEELVQGLTDLEQGRDPVRFTDHSFHNAQRLARAINCDGNSGCFNDWIKDSQIRHLAANPSSEMLSASEPHSRPTIGSRSNLDFASMPRAASISGSST